MVTLKDLYEKVRAYERDEDDQGALSDDILGHHFDMAWRKAHEIMSQNQIPCVSGWIARYVPAYASRVRLHSYGALHSIDVVEEKRAKASVSITAVTWDERGTIITTSSLTDLLNAGLTSGKQITILGLPGSMGLEGEFTVTFDETNQDQALLIPGLETPGIPPTFPSGGRVVYSEEDYSPISAVDGRSIAQYSIRDTFVLPSSFGVASQQVNTWAIQAGTVQFASTDYNRLIRLRGSFGVTSPTSLDDEIPDQLVSTLVPATAGYATLGVNRQRGNEMLREAFGTDGMIGGFIGAFIDNQMKARQVADIARKNFDNRPFPWVVV